MIRRKKRVSDGSIYLNLIITFLISGFFVCNGCLSTGTSYFCDEMSGDFLKHEEFGNIQALYLVNSDLTELSSSYVNIFTDLMILSVKNCSVFEEQIRILLNSLNNLREIEITHTNITEAIVTAINLNSELITAKFRHNQLNTIDGGLFVKSSKLKVVDFSYNQIYQVNISGDTNINVYNLENECASKSKIAIINLQGNRIAYIANYTFRNLSKLKYLDISKNFIQDIEIFAFNISDSCDVLPANVVLNFSQNLLSQLRENGFILCSLVTVLDLSNNQIALVHSKTFRGLSSLRRLLLGNNVINTLPWDVFQPLSELVELDLHKNGLKTILENAFHTLKNLTTLRLSSNRIQHLHSNAFYGLLSLKNLYLDDNGLKNFRGTFSVSMPQLMHLEMQMNLISVIEEDSFKGSPALTTLNLSENSITEIVNRAFSSNSLLRVLLLNRNSLSHLNCFSLFGLWALKTLDMGGNELKVFSLIPFSHLDDLEKLIIRLGSYSVCECEVFAKMKAKRVQIRLEKQLFGGECEILYKYYRTGERLEDMCGNFSIISNCSLVNTSSRNQGPPLSTPSFFGSNISFTEEITFSNKPTTAKAIYMTNTTEFYIIVYIIMGMFLFLCAVGNIILCYKIHKKYQTHVYEQVGMNRLGPATNPRESE